MLDAHLYDGLRSPFGRYTGALLVGTRTAGNAAVIDRHIPTTE